MFRPAIPFPVIVIFLAAMTPRLDAEDPYAEHVAPYINRYCAKCHSGKDAKGELDFEQFKSSADVVTRFRRWQNVVKFIRSGEMPPEKSPQPEIAESNAVVGHVEGILVEAARKQAGDPGVVLPRRLSNTEYDQSVSDLTGVTLRVTRDFPPDPAGGEGFDNTGEALGMSPNLLKKYLAAADAVSQHLVLKTDGIAFAPFPVTSYNERKKLTEQAIIDFYTSHAIDIPDYLEAAWRYQHRPPAEQGWNTEQWAEHYGWSARYLQRIFEALENAPVETPFWKAFLASWKAVPSPLEDGSLPAEWAIVRQQWEFGKRLFSTPHQQLIRSNAGNWPIKHLDFRTKTAATRDQFQTERLTDQTLVKGGRIGKPNAKTPDESTSIFVYIDPVDSSSTTYVQIDRPLFSKSDRLPNNEDEAQKHAVQTLRSVWDASNQELVRKWNFGEAFDGEEIDQASFVVAAPAVLEITLDAEQRQQLDGKHLLIPIRLRDREGASGGVFVRHARQALNERGVGPDVLCLVQPDSPVGQQWVRAGEHFCDVFPNRFFYVDERRGLAAGFHLVEGFFRDDQPLVEKVLSDQENRELDQLWRELAFVTQSHETLLRGFVWFERSERHVLHDKRFDFLRPEDPELVGAAILDRFEKLYLDKLGFTRIDDTLAVKNPSEGYVMVHEFFEDIRKGLAGQQKTLQVAETKALEQIKGLGGRVYRRPLTAAELESFMALYRKLRGADRTVEQSLRGVLTAMLMSPRFFYRYNLASEREERSELTDDALASRLSYFLWSSLPDTRLIQAASAGKLRDEKELVAQTRRMLKDPRVENFAREFLGQWLRYRDYLEKDPIHAAAFSDYDESLRQAMFDEPTQLATHLIQNDASVLALLNSDVSFVNARLAKHYGGAIQNTYRQEARDTEASEQDWVRVAGLQAAGRGGLLGMGVILTKASAGERTSPVKRGFWTVHHLLGQHFPPPPADVPELPESEKGAKQTIRELLSAHVADPQCAMCHKHFDSLGLALEGFDPIGRVRTKDAAGRPIDNRATLPDGKTAAGIPALIEYIERDRRDDFVRTLCRKFLGYALGRSVILSDQPLLDKMKTQLEQNDYRFGTLFEIVVLSSQFRQQRGSRAAQTLGSAGDSP